MIHVIDILLRLRILVAIIIALIFGAFLISATGNDPLVAYWILFRESFLDYYGLANTLIKTSPILLAGLAVIIPLRAGVYNIGGEGQIYIGALFATIVSLNLPELPSFIGIPVVMVAAFFGGALWAAIPGALKAYKGINEVIVTLLMNFVGIQIVSFAVSGPMLAKSAPYPYSEEIPNYLHLPKILSGTDAHLGTIIALTMSLGIYLFFRFTKIGFAMGTVGHSLQAARYAGISVTKNIVLAMVLGGGMAGVAGGFEVIGVKFRLFHMFSNGFGYDGIVAGFIASGSALWLPFVSIFLAGLKAGAGAMQRATGIERSVIDAIQGIIVILVAASLTVRTGVSNLSQFLKTVPQSDDGKEKSDAIEGKKI
jgi:general nucleoside transport system permease protein